MFCLYLEPPVCHPVLLNDDSVVRTGLDFLHDQKVWRSTFVVLDFLIFLIFATNEYFSIRRPDTPTPNMSIKKLSFKGDSVKKRKRTVTKSSTTSTTAEQSGTVDDEEGWLDADCLEDITGPTIVLFNYETPVSLCADSRGSVFTLPLDPVPSSLSDAEPHDVRQVFIASSLAGRPAGSISLKNGVTGRYVSTDRFGNTKCDANAIGGAEEWTAIKRPDGWSLQSAFDSFLSIDKAGAVRSDAQEIGFCETFKIRIQARTRAKRIRDSGTTTNSQHGKALPSLSKKDLETKCGRTLSLAEVDLLRDAQRQGSLSEAVLDMRVKGKSDKFG